MTIFLVAMAVHVPSQTNCRVAGQDFFLQEDALIQRFPNAFMDLFFDNLIIIILHFLIKLSLLKIKREEICTESAKRKDLWLEMNDFAQKLTIKKDDYISY